jgi:hypothetical protein
MTFRFIDAVQRLVPNFTKKEWDTIYEKAGARLHSGQLRKVFVILNDDDRPQSGRSANQQSASGSGSNSIPVSSRGRGSGRGRLGRGEPSIKRGPDADLAPPTPAKTRRGK